MLSKLRFVVMEDGTIVGKVIDLKSFQPGHVYTVADLGMGDFIIHNGESSATEIDNEPRERFSFRTKEKLSLKQSVDKMRCNAHHFFTYEEIVNERKRD